jgi:three-Cys-motif partner protein
VDFNSLLTANKQQIIMKATDNFFDRKRSWSELKDEILSSYLTPYLTKISHTYCPITIADCFAGKGMFDDGQFGSPLFIAQAIKNFIKQSKLEVEIEGVFIEKKYFKELEKNLHSCEECNWLTMTMKIGRLNL